MKKIIILSLIAILVLGGCGSKSDVVSKSENSSISVEESAESIEEIAEESIGESEGVASPKEEKEQKEVNVNEPMRTEYADYYNFNGIKFGIPKDWAMTTNDSVNGPFYLNNKAKDLRVMIEFNYQQDTTQFSDNHELSEFMYRSMADEIASDKSIKISEQGGITISGKESYYLRYTLKNQQVNLEVFEYLIWANDYFCIIHIMQENALSDTSLNFALDYADSISFE